MSHQQLQDSLSDSVINNTPKTEFKLRFCLTDGEVIKNEILLKIGIP